MTPDPPRTLDEAALRVRRWLAPETRERLRRMERDDLRHTHFTLGRAIRNELGLWRRDCPLTRPAPGEASAPHPDRVSARILERVWEMLRGEDGA